MASNSPQVASYAPAVRGTAGRKPQPLWVKFLIGFLIVVGVVLDTMRQVETHLIQRHYDGFLRKGRIRGRFDRTPAGRGEAVQQGALMWLYVGIAALIVAGLAAMLAARFR